MLCETLEHSILGVRRNYAELGTGSLPRSRPSWPMSVIFLNLTIGILGLAFVSCLLFGFVTFINAHIAFKRVQGQPCHATTLSGDSSLLSEKRWHAWTRHSGLCQWDGGGQERMDEFASLPQTCSAQSGGTQRFGPAGHSDSGLPVYRFTCFPISKGNPESR